MEGEIMAKHVSEFSVVYEDTCFADYFQGVGVADQNYWQGVALGVGCSDKDAANDACESLAQQTGTDCKYVVPEDVWAMIHKEVNALDDTCIEYEDEDEEDEDTDLTGSIIDETPNVYVAIYYR